ncbi:MAG: hypothetical protein OEO77_10665, partial [Acidimicrobiia bacterium]|nr:hypothetical protein [Acidimicrobiia bacterium]
GKETEGLERGAPISGIFYAVFATVGIMLLVISEIDSMPNGEILSHYAEGGNRTREIVGFFLVAAAALCFLWFMSTLRSRLRPAEAEPKTLSALVFGAGIAAAGLLVSAATLFVGTSFALEFSSTFTVDPNLAQFAFITGAIFLLSSVLVSCVVVAATSVLTLRTGAFPRWLGWFGFAAIFVALVEAALLPVFAIPIWVLVVSVVLMRNTRAEEIETT